MIKKSFKVHGMHCTSCPLVIESDLGDAGIKASCNYARATLDVEYDEARVTQDMIQEAVKVAGYALSLH